MAEKTLQTVIILRNDATTAWESTDAYILREGEVGIGYLTRDDGSTVVVAKVGNGSASWSNLPQIEGVFEKDQILTYNFGRHVTSNGYVNAGGKGMTTSEWLLDALSEILNPTTNYPTASLSAGTVTTDTGDTEIGSKITKFAWNGSSTTGSYKDKNNTGTYGTTTDNKSNASGISSNNFTWSISNNIDAQTGNKEDGTFTLTSDKYIQINSDSTATYAYLNGSVTLDPSSARIPLNNVGTAYEDGKIGGFDKAGTTTKTFTNVAVSVTGFRKPFWGWKSTADALSDPEGITGTQIRALGNSGTSATDLPVSLTVPAGTKQIFIAAKQNTKSSLTVKNVTKEPATSVACTMKAGHVTVPGANEFEGATYDLWYINLDAAFTGETKLSLTWA